MEINNRVNRDNSISFEDIDKRSNKTNDTTFVDSNRINDEIIIEEISRNHKLLHRHRIKQNNINIGRDYHNDIILSDPYICPKHISLRYSQGAWLLSDNDSINGTKLENSNDKKRKNKREVKRNLSQESHQQIIHDGDIITLGKSQLRVVFKDHHVADTVAFSPFEHIIDIIRNPLAVFLSIALFMLIAAYNTYLNQPSETNISQLFVGAFSKSILFALWPICIALISHLTKNEPRILAQLGISFTFYILIWIVNLIEEVIIFNTASNPVMDIASTLLAVSMAFSLFWLNCYIGYHLSAKRRISVALCITILLFGGSYLLQYSKKPEFDPMPRYDATIMAPSYLLAPSNNVADFIEESKNLFTQASEAAQSED
ncbi:FHA domain-containing protein [Colwellia echini]|uniref:FHA domain-containing protein n=1 Tax=Colwellia echini TaxID=1982103 RepID=A0ABY3MVJ9_9GAMM|nr:FHA domain-containing protein [Colwellia echini]TYK65238.1 FHA domain-containing protein [Colwellia echini]